MEAMTYLQRIMLPETLSICGNPACGKTIVDGQNALAAVRPLSGIYREPNGPAILACNVACARIVIAAHNLKPENVIKARLCYYLGNGFAGCEKVSVYVDYSLERFSCEDCLDYARDRDYDHDFTPIDDCEYELDGTIGWTLLSGESA